MQAKAIFTYTRSGATAKRAARERPTVPIIGLSPERITARQLALIWGVHTIHALEPKSFSGMINNACELAKKEGIVKKGDYVVVYFLNFYWYFRFFLIAPFSILKEIPQNN